MPLNKFSSNFIYMEKEFEQPIKIGYMYDNGKIVKVFPLEYKTLEEALYDSIPISSLIDNSIISDKFAYKKYITGIIKNVESNIMSDALIEAHDYISDMYDSDTQDDSLIYRKVGRYE